MIRLLIGIVVILLVVVVYSALVVSKMTKDEYLRFEKDLAMNERAVSKTKN